MNRKGKYLFCPGIFLAAAIMGVSGCSARKLLPFDDKLVSSVDDDAKKEKAYMVDTPTPTPVPEPTATPTPTPGALQPLIDEADKFAVQNHTAGAALAFAAADLCARQTEPPQYVRQAVVYWVAKKRSLYAVDFKNFSNCRHVPSPLLV